MMLALGMAIIVFIVGFIPISPYILLPIQILVGAIIVFFICEITKLEEYIQLKQIALDVLKRKK